MVPEYKASTRVIDQADGNFSVYLYCKYYSFTVSPLSGRIKDVRFHLDNSVVQTAAVSKQRLGDLQHLIAEVMCGGLCSVADIISITAFFTVSRYKKSLVILDDTTTVFGMKVNTVHF